MFRQAICNEVFRGWDFAQQCRTLKQLGYEAIEIAPFTLADDPASIPPQRRSELKRIMADEGVQFAGLHWLMVAPKGLHVTTPEAGVRARSWLHIETLIDLCGELGGGLMIFGSPAQRKTIDGATRKSATARYIDGLATVAGHAQRAGVTILIEALPFADTDVVNSLDEAARYVRQIDHPAIRTMYDSHNAIDETEPHDIVVDRHFDLIHHVHVNEMDGRHPGTGNWDFKPVLRTLQKRGYTGWISLEVFDFTQPPEKVARESIEHIKKEIATLDR